MHRRTCSSDRQYGSIILYLKAQNWVSLVVYLWHAILLYHRNALRNPLFISPILSVTHCYLKANSLSSWAVLQPRLHSHQASLELLSAAKLKLLVETSIQVDKNTITLLTHHQSTIHPKTKTLQDCTCWGCASPLFIFHRTSDRASILHLARGPTAAQYLQCLFHTAISVAGKVSSPPEETKKTNSSCCRWF